MGKLYEAKLKIDKYAQENKQDVFKVRGAISLRAGVLLSIIKENTPDDAAQLKKLTDVTFQVIGLKI